MLDKVRKLLAKAEDPACTREEAEALTAKAAELIAKYGIDQAMLAAGGTQRPQAVGNRLVELQGPYLREKAHLLHVVAESPCTCSVSSPTWPGSSCCSRPCWCRRPAGC
jgi:hypothetical protein